MLLSPQPELDFSSRVQHTVKLRNHRKCSLVTANRLFGYLTQADALDRSPCSKEKLVHELLVQPESVEYLGATIGLVGGDAHLRHYLQDTLSRGLHVLGLRNLYGDPRQLAPLDDIPDRLERQVRVDALGPVAPQDGEVVDRVGLSCFDDESDERP